MNIKKLLPGLGLTLGVTLFATLIDKSGLLKSLGLSSLTLAIILGMVIGNTVFGKIAEPVMPGVLFSKGQLLRLGIILYGFRVTLQQIGEVGLNSVLTDIIMLTSTFLLTVYLARRMFRLNPHTAMLMGAGAGICGAAAVMATEPLLKTRSHRVTVAVATVVIFGTISMFLYPILYKLGGEALMGSQFGTYIGSTVHEVAQVVAAGNEISSDISDKAVITKMIRVMMLAPFLIVLSWYLSRKSKSKSQEKSKIAIPWFALWFVVVVCFNSLDWTPAKLVDLIKEFDTLILAMAMSALGLTTHASAIRQAGSKPFILGGIILLWLVVGGGIINVLMARMFG